MSDDRLVIVGASLAGLRAVEAARRGGFAGPMTLVGAEPYLPYDRPALSKKFLHAGGDEDHPPYRTRAELEQDLATEVLLGQPARGLQPDPRSVLVGEREVPYDRLIIATGAQARELPGLSAQVPGVFYLRTVDDSRALRTALEAGPKVVVIGAGFIGSEIASAARARGLDVTVVEGANLPLVRSVGPDVGTVCADIHRAHGTQMRLGVPTVGVEQQDGRVSAVVLADGSRLPADVVVVGVGVRPATDWLEGSSVRLHSRDGGVICDESLWTGVPGVYAAGDVAHVPNPLADGVALRLEHWTAAAEMGALAARNALNPIAPQPCSLIPYFWSDWYEHRLQFVGTTLADDVVVTNPDTVGFTALYRRGDRLVGAFTVDRSRDIMKLRRHITRQTAWADVLKVA
ncbi:NAD(P)/FAD-dependent oxidoreductase [Demetria terragena]|uniref:NAD(P)/FAD-dependent oxidoreductase n=1 Tax=Demetria terragena TaxID=63959 RepID=UPI00037F0AB7|nr:FAD-dependent oxidoreductase [Demetria terragena]